jgi:hypothetical protein
MNECLILIDDYKFLNEGRKYSAEKKGFVDTKADSNRKSIYTSVYQTEEDKRTENAHCDIVFGFPSTTIKPIDYWYIKYNSLIEKIANGNDIIKIFFTNRGPHRFDHFWEEPKIKALTKCFKTNEMEAAMSSLDVIYEHKNPAILKLLSVDRGFIPLADRALKMNWEVELWGFEEVLDSCLSCMATRICLINDDIFNDIGYSLDDY